MGSPRTDLGILRDEDRLPKVAAEAIAALEKYLQRHDEMYLMDAYRLLKDEVGE